MENLGEPLSARQQGRMSRRIAIAGILGTTMETFDFIVYGYLVIYIAPSFFPAGDSATSILASLAVFAVGFIARPLGGIYFGRMGDRRGRRFTLLVTVTIMGLATCILGALPDYSAIGIVAPILLMVARLLQGFSAGGEVIGSSTYVVESSTSGRRGLFSSATPLGSVLGITLVPVVVGITTAVVGADQMASWGWRIPFLVALPLTIACLIFRLRIEDSPEFLALLRRQEVATAPFREVRRNYWRSVIAVVMIAIAVSFLAYTLVTYIPVYLSSTVELAPGTIYWITGLATALASPALLLSGMAIDRFGRKVVLISGMAASAVIVFPAMTVMGGAFNSPVGVGFAYWLLLCCSFASQPPAFHAYFGFFPARVRYTGAAIGYNIGNAVGGGFGPYLSAQLTAWTHEPRSPSILVAIVAIICIGTVLISSRLRTDIHGEKLESVNPTAPAAM
ncbi:MFS transporter [Streptomyces solisilvae]|uniref:MFS transporter n=1 Tax=Streptomyces malaysiensis TaxID=92644 RepID=UPI00367670DE